jgi:hypothetical protein
VFWLQQKRQHRASSKKASRSLCHLSRRGIHRSRRTRWRCSSWRRWRRKNQRHEIGRVLLCFQKELLHFFRVSRASRAHLFPVHIFTMWVSQAIIPSTPLLTEESFSWSTRSSKVSKALTRFLRLSIDISFLFFGNNPTNWQGSTWRVRYSTFLTFLQFDSRTPTVSSRGSFALSRQSLMISPSCSAASRKNTTSKKKVHVDRQG